MARIRTIKPEFTQSESIGRLSRDARLIFILLWTICDDEGRTRASSRMLASILTPYDEDSRGLMEGWLQELEREHCIQRYIAEDNQYLQITNWEKHQKIDRPSKSRLPEAPKLLAKPRENSRALDADLGPRTVVPRIESPSDSCAVAQKSATRTNGYDEAFEEFWKAYPKREGANPKAPAAKKFTAYLKSGQVTLETIMAGVKHYAAECRKQNRVGTPYIPMTKTWLEQSRWEAAQQTSFLDRSERPRPP